LTKIRLVGQFTNGLASTHDETGGDLAMETAFGDPNNPPENAHPEAHHSLSSSSQKTL